MWMGIVRAPLANLGLQGKIGIMGLHSVTLFEIGITEISFEIGIMDLKSDTQKCRNAKSLRRSSPYLKLGLRDYAGLEIGITGLQNPPPWGPYCC